MNDGFLLPSWSQSNQEHATPLSRGLVVLRAGCVASAHEHKILGKRQPWFTQERMSRSDERIQVRH